MFRGLLLRLLISLFLAASHAFKWTTDLVVVVTWYHKPIDWIAVLPPDRATLAIYAKGGASDYTCANISAQVRPLVAYCQESFNAAGREAHTMALFSSDHRHHLPNFVYFTQDDEPYYKPFSIIAGMSDIAFAQWKTDVVRVPFANFTLCLCDVAQEPKFNRTHYGEHAFDDITWFLGTFVNPHKNWSLHSTIRWATGAQFVLPGSLIRHHPVSMYRTIEALLNGTDQRNGHKPASLQHEGTSALQWAHFFERMWWAIWDPHYSPLSADYAARLAGSSVLGALN